VHEFTFCCLRFTIKLKYSYNHAVIPQDFPIAAMIPRHLFPFPSPQKTFHSRAIPADSVIFPFSTQCRTLSFTLRSYTLQYSSTFPLRVANALHVTRQLNIFKFCTSPFNKLFGLNTAASAILIRRMYGLITGIRVQARAVGAECG